MNNFTYPENYSLESFGSQPAAPKSRRNLYILLGCGGCLVLCVLLCVCCLGGSVIAVRQPTILVSVWGAYMTNGSYQFAEAVTCEGSQALQLTRDLADQGATFPNFGTPMETNGNIEIITSIRVNGETSPWEATFIIQEGGTFGRCIDRIEVAEN